MLDVHLLVTHRLPAGWLEQAIESIFEARRAAPFPIAVQLVGESVGDFWGARWRGYDAGTSEYMTYLDADDWLEPDAFNCLLEPMQSGADMIVVQGRYHNLSTGKVGIAPRGMRVVRRSYAEGFDRSDTRGCCPACTMQRHAKNPVTIMQPNANFRVGYDSLALQWRREHGVA